MRRRITVTGAADVDVAWERYADLQAWPRWAPQITGVEAASARLAPGLTGLVRGPVGVVVPFRVLAVDETARSWEWVATMLGVEVRMHHDLTAVDAGTRAGLTLEGPAPVAVAYGPVARVALRRLVAR